MEKTIADTIITINDAERFHVARLEVAKNMLDIGMTFEQIRNLTKLPINKIKGLKK